MEVRHISGEHNVVADWLSRSVVDDDPFDDIHAISVPVYIAQDVVEPMVDLPPSLLPIVNLPTVHNLRAATSELSEIELRATYRGSDGLRYHVRSHKVFIPPSFRESFIYWFHVTSFGGHSGIGRTVRRLSQYVWWPYMKQSVTEYMKGCLVCIRRSIPPKLSTYSGVLSRPFPFQLISLDFVGPRNWSGITYHYLVIIDHASRFIVARAIDRQPTA